MTLKTLAKYLFLFDRQAVREIAACRQAVWLGLVFVISAGFAREYDGEDLLAEPWHLMLPLVASLVTSFVLFGLVWLVDRSWKWDERPFKEAYVSFLGLYWMTAPLAWLYAIPVERFLSPAESVQANLWLLGIVATWRVLLMIRVVSTLWQFSMWRAMVPVLFFADTLAVAILFLTPLPVFSIMGGIRLSEGEQIIQATAFFVGFFGIVTWPIWLAGTAVIATKPLKGQSPRETRTPSPNRVSRPLWGLGMISVVVWVFILPLTQPEQQLRRNVEQLLYAGKFEEALKALSAHERTDFPPHWDPPPRVGYGENTPDLPAVMEALIATETKAWVEELYWKKFEDRIGQDFGFHVYWRHLDQEDWDRHLTVLERLPQDSQIFLDQRDHWKWISSDDSENLSLTESQKERLRELLGPVELETEEE